MKFETIANTLEKLEKTTKRLEKILILRDFLTKYPKDAPLVFDMLSGDMQREIDKKTLSISLKTIFSVLSSISQKNESQIEKDFNKKGDIGEIAKQTLEKQNQSSLLRKELNLNTIKSALLEISKITGTNSNKKKKEILSNLFLSAKTPQEHKYLARFLIDDLRVGTSQGTLKEAAVISYFPQIISINNICQNCGYNNLNNTLCLSCKMQIDTKTQLEIASKKYSIIELETPKKQISLQNYDIQYEINTIEFALRRNKDTQILYTSNPRELYNNFLNLFEKKYNLINSFTKILKELDSSLINILKSDIQIKTPIKSMLGPNAKNITDAFETVSKPALIDYKYDGLRTQIHNDYGNIKIFTRNLDEITNQFPEIVEFIKNNFSDCSFIIDSECVGYDYEKQRFLPFQTLSKRILTKEIKNVSHINITIKAFDILYYNHQTLIDMPYKKRREILQKLFINKPLKQKIHFDIDKLKKI